VAIAVGEGAVWVAGATGTVERIDPRTLARTPMSDSVSGPAGIAVGEGFVWVTSQADGTVTRFDPVTGRREGSPIAVGAAPTDIAIGGGGVWVANSEQTAGTVTRIDPGSGEAGEPIEVASGQVFALTYGEGGVWVASSDELRGDRIEISRIDPETSEVEGEFIRLERPGLPVRLSAGMGSVWVAQGGGDPLDPQGPGTVVRIDPADRRLAGEPAEIPSGPTGISVGEGAVWVVSGVEGSVVRVSGPR